MYIPWVRCVLANESLLDDKHNYDSPPQVLILNLISGVEWRVDDYSIKIETIPDSMRGLSQE